MNRILCLIALSMVVACSMSESDRCSEGRVWSPEYNGCVEPNGTGGGSSAATGGKSPAGGETGSTSLSAGTAGATAPNAPGAAGAPSTDGSNLGQTCRSDADCTSGVATSCLLNPQAPADPGMCTIVDCDAAACGEPFDCCACAQSPILSASWPKPKCVPTANTGVLIAIACTCS